MSITSILGFIALAGWILVVVGAGIAVSNIAQNRPARGGIGLAILGLFIGILFFIASSGLVEVGPSEVAVVFQRIGGNPATNGLWERPLGPGVHIIAPVINEPIIYSTQVQTYTMSKAPIEGQLSRDDAVQARTKDGQQVDIDVSTLFSVDPEKANLVHIKWRNRFTDDFVRPTVRAAVRERIASYSVNDLYGGTGAIEGEAQASLLPQVQRQLYEDLSKTFSDNGLRLQDLLLREITFSEEFIRAVEAKQVAQQQVEQAQQDAERERTIARGRADAAVTAAEGEARSAEARARGEANAIKLRAAAEAEALNLINEQISKNPNLIYWRYIENLSDNISMILLPSNSPFLFDLNQLTQITTPSQTNTIPAPNAQSTPAEPEATATPRP